MPVYTYRREDGTTFDYRQKFTDEPLTTDPETGQHVFRVIQPAGVIFKGSGFYVNDSKSASRNAVTAPAKTDHTDHSDHDHSGHDHTQAEKSDKVEKPAEAAKPAAEAAPAKAPAATTATAD